jgi:3-hydroxyisobutyrate dehydrogenase-like beta-hydroxyacid dehydrogenase
LIGLGLVGQALAARLAAAGFEVVGFDVDLRKQLASTAPSAAEVARRCKRILLAVFDTADVEQVAAQAKPELFVDCTTGDPDRIERLAAKLRTEGVSYVEAPLSGSSEAIRRGEALMLTSGDTAPCEDLLDAIANRRMHVGAVGMAARAKLATNLVLGLNRAALAEGMAFAESQGIGRSLFLKLVEASPAASVAALAKGERMVRGDWTPESRIRQHLKDVERMLHYGKGLPLSEAHARLLRDAVAAGDGELDNAAIIRRWRTA